MSGPTINPQTDTMPEIITKLLPLLNTQVK